MKDNINDNAKQELETILDKLVVSKIESKLANNFDLIKKEIKDESLSVLSELKKIPYNLREYKDAIIDVIESLNFQNEDKVDNLFKKIESIGNSIVVLYSKIEDCISKNNEFINTINDKITQIKDVNLKIIFDNIILLIGTQNKNTENLLVELNNIAKSQSDNVAKIKLENATNKEQIENNLFDMQLNINNLLEKVSQSQINNFQELVKSISNFTEIENSNNQNLNNQLNLLDNKFQIIEQMKLELATEFDIKVKSLENKNENYFVLITKKNNIAFIILLATNILTIGLLMFNYFIKH